MDAYVSVTEFESEFEDVIKEGDDVDIDLSKYATKDQVSSFLSDYALMSEMSIVAETGSFFDAIGSENVLVESVMQSELNSYITIDQFEELKTEFDDVSQEISENIRTEINDLNSDIEGNLIGELSNYDESSIIDQKLLNEFELLQSTMNALIASASIELKPKSMVETSLEQYLQNEDLDSSLDSVLDKYLVFNEMNLALSNYITEEEFSAIAFLDATSNVLFIDASIVTLNAEVVMEENISIKRDMIANSLSVGISSPNEIVQIHQAQSGGGALQFTNDSTGSEIGDGLLLRMSEAGAGQIILQEELPLVWSVAGNEIIKVSDLGKVGIGNSDPQFDLDLNGALNFSGNLYYGGEVFESGSFKRSEDDANLTYYSDGNVGIGVDNPQEKLTVEGKVIAESFEGDGSALTGVEPGAPQNIIGIWSGSVGDIPSGWALCDGSNGTPDLTARFVVGYSGSGDYGSVGNKGGKNTYSLTTENMPAHNHSISMSSDGAHNHPWGVSDMDDHNHSGNGEYVSDSDSGIRNWRTSSGTNHSHSLSVSSTGNGSSVNNMPEYYVVAFIMKL